MLGFSLLYNIFLILLPLYSLCKPLPNVSPLRYADRIKERVVGGQAAKNAAALAANPNPNPIPRKVDSNGSPPNSALNANKDRNVRNREIQKVPIHGIPYI